MARLLLPILLVAFIAIIPMFSARSPILRKGVKTKTAKEALGNIFLLSLRGGLQRPSRLPNHGSSSEYSLMLETVTGCLHLRGGDETLEKGQDGLQSPLDHAQGSNVANNSPTSAHSSEIAPDQEKTEGTAGGSVDGPEAEAGEGGKIEEDGNTQEGEAHDNDETGIPVEELVAYGRVAIAEQNYSLAADYLSAAMKQQVTRLCATPVGTKFCSDISRCK
jgi:hypothetical protein